MADDYPPDACDCICHRLHACCPCPCEKDHPRPAFAFGNLELGEFASVPTVEALKEWMPPMKIIKVRCTFTLDVKVPDGDDYDAKFDIEDNHCPGTGIVGATLERLMREGKEKGICWACNCQGTNEIVG